MPGLLRGVARTAAVVGTASAVNGRVQRRQQGKWAAQDQAAAEQQQAEAAAAAPPPPPEAPQTSKYAQLKEVAELKESGVLTNAEFEAQKALILGG